jgi:hypothetical protein
VSQDRSAGVAGRRAASCAARRARTTPSQGSPSRRQHILDAHDHVGDPRDRERVARCVTCRQRVAVGPRLGVHLDDVKAWLVIEVAETSLARDRGIKARLYAATGIGMIYRWAPPSSARAGPQC